MEIRKALKVMIALALALSALVIPALSHSGDPGQVASAANLDSTRSLTPPPLDWGPDPSGPTSSSLASERPLTPVPLDWGTDPTGTASSSLASERPLNPIPLDWGTEPTGPASSSLASERPLNPVPLDWGTEPSWTASSSLASERPLNPVPLDWGTEPSGTASSSLASERPLNPVPLDWGTEPSGTASSSLASERPLNPVPFDRGYNPSRPAVSSPMSSMAASGPAPKTEVHTSEVFFDPSSARLRPEAMEPLAGLVFTLRNHPGYKVKIVGHPDPDPAGPNLTLSHQRAASIKSFLTANGIAAQRLTVAPSPARSDDRKVVISVYQ
jgi:outer membrane protein OmpA-like peptidoglycan-associated protein